MTCVNNVVDDDKMCAHASADHWLTQSLENLHKRAVLDLSPACCAVTAATIQSDKSLKRLHCSGLKPPDTSVVFPQNILLEVFFCFLFLHISS